MTDGGALQSEVYRETRISTSSNCHRVRRLGFPAPGVGTAPDPPNRAACSGRLDSAPVSGHTQHTLLVGRFRLRELSRARTSNYRGGRNRRPGAQTGAVPVSGASADSRAFVVDSVAGANSAPGTLTSTTNQLDIAFSGNGMLAVQRRDGSEAYTRAGKLQTDASNVLRTFEGHRVVGRLGQILFDDLGLVLKYGHR